MSSFEKSKLILIVLLVIVAAEYAGSIIYKRSKNYFDSQIIKIQNTASTTDTNNQIKPTTEGIYRYGNFYEKDSAGYYYELGFDKWRENTDYENAKTYYEKALEVDPNYAPALSSLGLT